MATPFDLQRGDMHMRVSIGVAAVAALALGTIPAHAGDDDELGMRVVAYWWKQAVAPPKFEGETPAKPPPEQTVLFEHELNKAQPSPFAYVSPLELLRTQARPPWWRPGDGQPAYGDSRSWPQFESIAQPLSDAERQVLGKRIAALSLQSNPSAREPNESGADIADMVWNENPLHLVIAGPAVKDGVATYRTEPDGTHVRIPMNGAEIPERLYRWATQRGFPMRLSVGPKLANPLPDEGPFLHETAREGQLIFRDTVMTIEAETALPSWVVSADGIFPARVVAFSTVGANSPSGACRGSDWLELVLKGDVRSPIWAVLLSSRPNLSRSATIKRLPPATGETPYLEGKRSEIELRWADAAIPALRLAARRFDYSQAIYAIDANGNYQKTDEQILGSAWGVQVFNADQPAPNPNEGWVQSVAASGSPRCAPP